MENQNDIEVKDFTIVSSSSEIEKAKKTLRDNGYFVDNLWQIYDVTDNYECTEEEAQNILFEVFDKEIIGQEISEMICLVAERMKLKQID